MNLKKIGSMLTSIAMIASLATYVPTAAFAADDTAAEADKIYTVDSLELDPTVKVSLNATDKLLTISPAVADAEYTVPKDVLGLFAYEYVGDAAMADYDSADEIAKAVTTIKVEGKATLTSIDVTGATELALLQADCRAEIDGNSVTDESLGTVCTGLSSGNSDAGDVIGQNLPNADTNETGIAVLAAGAVAGEVVHDMVANTDVHNHYCKYGDKYDNSFESHTFVADKATGTHKCECGLTDLDYYNAKDTEHYNKIHDFSDETHLCSTCGAYNKVLHDDKDNLTYTRTANGHSVSCKGEKCKYTEAETAHVWDVNVKDNDLTVAGIKIPVNSHYCTVCGYVNETAKHDYSYIYQPVKNAKTGAYEMKIVEAPTGTTGVVCVCGKRIDTHTDASHTWKMENGFHYCICGETSDEHAYNYAYDENGKLVKATEANKLTGVICGCGNVDPNHTTGGHKANHIDTDKHQHLCSCGAVVDGQHSYEAKNGHHTCACGDVDDTKHTFNKVYREAADKNGAPNLVEANSEGVAEETTEVGCICACGAVDSNHVHKYTIGDKTNSKDYCTCGAVSDSHTYAEGSNKCKVCGYLKDHEHTLNSDCKCTDEDCGKYVHTWKAVAGKGYHICTVCGVKSNAGTESVAGVNPHTYVADKTTHKHVCVCGAVSDTHTYGDTGAAQCVCQECGFDNHKIVVGDNPKTTDVEEKHYCKTCDTDFSDKHTFDRVYNAEGKLEIAADNNGLVCECKEVKDHDCKFSVNRTTDSAELCACGKVLEHDIIIDSTNGTQHKCSHEGCALAASAHKPVNGFCECGAVDPTFEFSKGTTIASIKKDSNNTLNPGSLKEKYTTAYIVKLAKAQEAVLAYNSADAVEGVKSAKTADEQAAFKALVADYLAVVADKENNKAASSVTAALATGNDTYGEIVKVDNDFTQYGKVGSTVTITAVAKDGYVFDGWYGTAAANTAKISSDASYEATIADGATTYYAKFVENTKVQIRFDKGLSYATKDPSDTANWTEVKNLSTPSFALGTTLYVKVTALGGETLIGIKDSTGNYRTYNFATVGTDNDCYSFKVTAADSLGYDTFSEPADGKYIAFKVGGKVVSAAECANGNAVAAGIVPADPTQDGHTFAGWYYESDAKKTVVRLKTLAESGVLVPKFDKITGLKVEVENGYFGKGYGDKTYSYGDTTVITADEKNAEGKYFSGWYVDGVKVTTERTTMITVTGNIKYVARYDLDEPMADTSFVSLSAERKTVDAGYQVVVFNSTRTMATDCKVLQSGIVYTTKDGTVVSDLKFDNSAVSKKYSDTDKRIGTYALTLNLKSAAAQKATVYARAYVLYTDANGVQQAEYSDMIAVAPLA